MSRFRTCAISWAITPWSSSRFIVLRRPVVTAMDAWSGSRPVANAFGSGSSIRKTRGIGRPAAIVISVTTFMSRLMSGEASSAVTARAKLEARTARSPKR